MKVPIKGFARGVKFEGFLEGEWRSEGVEVVDVIGGLIVNEDAVVIGCGGGGEVEFGETRVGDQRLG